MFTLIYESITLSPTSGDPMFGTGELRHENFGTRMGHSEWPMFEKKLQHHGNFGTKLTFGTKGMILGTFSSALIYVRFSGVSSALKFIRVKD